MEHGGGGEVLGVGDSARHGLLVHHEAPSHAWVDLGWVLSRPQAAAAGEGICKAVMSKESVWMQ